MMSALQLTFTPAAAYYDALLTSIPKAQKRIIIHAMSIWWSGRTERLAPLLIDAAKRGVEVRIVGDRYSKFQATVPRFSRTPAPTWKHTQAINEQLRQNGVRVTYIGKVGLNPYQNRCHSKITIIDDQVYTFGGVNFTDDSFENHDSMLAAQDNALAERLYTLVRSIEEDPVAPLPDLREPLDDANNLLFDGGTPGASVIYETACTIVGDAKKVYFVSQMSPSGRLAKLITATENECYLIQPSQAEFPANVDLAWDTFRYKIKNQYKGTRFIHAKLILTEGHDGSKHVISGSNNFSWRGVKYGTKEIALHSTNPKLWQDFYDFLHQEIAV